MRYLIKKDLKNRKIFVKNEVKRMFFKIFFNDLQINIEMRLFFYYQFNLFVRKAAVSRIRNLCLFTGRSRAVFRVFGVYRSVLKNLITTGFLSGIRKSSW